MTRSVLASSRNTPRIHVRHVLAVTLTTLALSAQAQGTAAPADTMPAANASAAAFTRADANADGKLTREEAARMPAIASKFSELDKDKDGVLNAAEFEAGAAVKQ